MFGEALKLIDDIGIKVLVTIDGSENAYAKKIVDKYKNLKSISFIGLQSRKTIFDYYGKVTGLIFPSKLETWGIGTATNVHEVSIKVDAATGAQLKNILRSLPDGITYELALEKEEDA